MNTAEREITLHALSAHREVIEAQMASAQATYDRATATARDTLREIARTRDLLSGLDEVATMIVARLDTPEGLAGLDPEYPSDVERLAAAFRGPEDDAPPADATAVGSWELVRDAIHDPGVPLHAEALRAAYFGGTPPVAWANAETHTWVAWTRVLGEAHAMIGSAS